ncbi:MAG: hypothetical protein ACRDFX_14645 [Chloroflexota bacterium]
MVATFALVFAGCGAIVIDHLSHGQIKHFGVAMSFGLVIAAMIYAVGHISSPTSIPRGNSPLWPRNSDRASKSGCGTHP